MAKRFVRRARARILEEAEMAIHLASDAKSLVSGVLAIRGVADDRALLFCPEGDRRVCPEVSGVEILVQEDTTAQLLKQSDDLRDRFRVGRRSDRRRPL